MSIYIARRKDGSQKSPYFQFDFVCKINGERRRFHGSTGETTEKAAREYERREKARLKSQGPLDDMTLAAACYRYSAEIGPQIRSADDLETSFEHCCRLIGGGRLLINLTSEEISSAVHRRAAETTGKFKKRLISPATANRQIAEPMQRLMRRAKVTWRVQCKPDEINWSDLKLKEPKERVREFTTAEAEAFWANLRPDYVPFVWFLASRGPRVRSAFFKKFEVDIPRRRALMWKKGEGKVWVALSQVQCEVILQEMKKAPAIKQVWTYEKNKEPNKGKRVAISYNSLKRVMNTALNAAGISDFRIHDLRHDFASKLLRKTRDISLVQKSLGHADLKSTSRYAHITREDIGAGLDQMEIPEWHRPWLPEVKIVKG